HTLVAEVDLPIGTRVDQPVSTASIIVPGHEHEPLHGEGLGLAPTVGARTQSQSFLFRVSQVGFPLRPGIAVTGYLNIPGEPLQGVMIPQSAVVRLVGKAWVYVQIADDQFTRREIALDRPVADGWFTTATFGTSDRIVVRGAQMLLSEEFKSQIQIGEEGEGG
ncbi:MAG TPA: multidrug transporter, partial [Phycisphaerae bacterium]